MGVGGGRMANCLNTNEFLNNNVQLLMRVKKLCCHIPLKIKIPLVASFEIIASIVHVLLLTIPFSDTSSDSEGHLCGEPPEDPRKIMAFLLMHLLHIIVSLLLIIGVITNQSLLMFPSICIEFTAIFLAIAASSTVFAIPDVSWGYVFLLFFLLLVALFVLTHLFSVHYCYYEDLRYQNFESSTAKTDSRPEGF